MFALYGGGGRGASCVWLLAALVALHVSASAQSEVVPCGYNIQGDDCAKAKSEGSWGLNEGKKQDQVSTTTPMTWLAAVGTFIFLLFGLRVLYIIRLRQQLLHRGGSRAHTRTPAGSDFLCLHSNGCKQILRDDLFNMTTVGDEGTLWVMLSKKKTNPNDLCEAVVEITPVHWKRVKEGVEEPAVELQDRPSKFGMSRDSSVSLTSSALSLSLADSEVPAQDAANRTADASGRSCVNGMGRELQPLGDACCICLERCSDVRFGLCKHAAVCRECWLTTLHSWKKSSAPTCPMCRMPVPSFSVFDAARGACDEESQCGGGSQRDLPLRFRSIHEASQDEERAVPQPYSLARPVEALPEEGGSPPGGLAAWFMRPFESQNAASQQEEAQPLSVMRPFETQPGTIVYPLDTSQHGDSTTMRPFEAPMVMMRPLASEATLEDSHLPQISVTTPPRPGEPGVSLTASIVFPSVDAPDAYTTSMTPVVRASN